MRRTAYSRVIQPVNKVKTLSASRFPRRSPKMLWKEVGRVDDRVDPAADRMRAHAAKLREADLFHPKRRMQTPASREGIDALFLVEPFAVCGGKQSLHARLPQHNMGAGRWNENDHALSAQLNARHLYGRTGQE